MHFCTPLRCPCSPEAPAEAISFSNVIRQPYCIFKTLKLKVQVRIKTNAENVIQISYLKMKNIFFRFLFQSYSWFKHGNIFVFNGEIHPFPNPIFAGLQTFRRAFPNSLSSLKLSSKFRIHKSILIITMISFQPFPSFSKFPRELNPNFDNYYCACRNEAGRAEVSCEQDSLKSENSLNVCKSICRSLHKAGDHNEVNA